MIGCKTHEQQQQQNKMGRNALTYATYCETHARANIFGVFADAARDDARSLVVPLLLA